MAKKPAPTAIWCKAKWPGNDDRNRAIIMRFVKTGIAVAALLSAISPASAEYVAMENYLSEGALQFVYEKNFGLGSANQSTAWAYARLKNNPGVCDDELLLLLDDAIKELERSQQTLIE
jgi:hypothetical protein